MRTKSRIALLSMALVLAACQGLKTRDQMKRQRPPPPSSPAAPPLPGQPAPPAPSPDLSADDEASPVEPQAPAPPPPAIPKIGLILGPGGARTFAHVGVLQEMQKEKIPVVAVAGIEWAAPIAALYARKGLANEAEWQMSKLKTEDVAPKSLIGRSKTPDAGSLREFLKLAFGNARAEDGTLPFACPAQNLAKNQVFLMSKGAFENLLPFCMSYPPSLRPWQGNVAGMRDVKLVADHLRARGASVIVLVNVLPAPNPARPVAGDDGNAEGVLWNEISALYAKPLAGVDQVLQIPLGNAGIMSFDDRRDLLHKGAEQGASPVRQLAKRLGL